jgi:hypothetical protein
MKVEKKQNPSIFSATHGDQDWMEWDGMKKKVRAGIKFSKEIII